MSEILTFLYELHIKSHFQKINGRKQALYTFCFQELLFLSIHFCLSFQLKGCFEDYSLALARHSTPYGLSYPSLLAISKNIKEENRCLQICINRFSKPCQSYLNKEDVHQYAQKHQICLSWVKAWTRLSDTHTHSWWLPFSLLLVLCLNWPQLLSICHLIQEILWSLFTSFLLESLFTEKD